MRANRGINAGDPKGPEGSFLGLAVPVRKLSAPVDGISGNSVQTTPDPRYPLAASRTFFLLARVFTLLLALGIFRYSSSIIFATTLRA